MPTITVTDAELNLLADALTSHACAIDQAITTLYLYQTNRGRTRAVDDRVRSARLRSKLFKQADGKEP